MDKWITRWKGRSFFISPPFPLPLFLLLSLPHPLPGPLYIVHIPTRLPSPDSGICFGFPPHFLLCRSLLFVLLSIIPTPSLSLNSHFKLRFQSSGCLNWDASRRQQRREVATTNVVKNNLYLKVMWCHCCCSGTLNSLLLTHSGCFCLAPGVSGSFSLCWSSGHVRLEVESLFRGLKFFNKIKAWAEADIHPSPSKTKTKVSVLLLLLFPISAAAHHISLNSASVIWQLQTLQAPG